MHWLENQYAMTTSDADDGFLPLIQIGDMGKIMAYLRKNDTDKAFNLVATLAAVSCGTIVEVVYVLTSFI